jgi:uncharacterized membrane protein
MELHTLHIAINKSSAKIPPSLQAVFHIKVRLTALDHLISVTTTLKVIEFPRLLMRIKFFRSYHHLVADAREWVSLTLNIPPFMMVIK